MFKRVSRVIQGLLNAFSTNSQRSFKCKLKSGAKICFVNQVLFEKFPGFYLDKTGIHAIRKYRYCKNLVN
ncbi:hypothetical protein JCM21531_3797 [Acetivibrio straminisolvens JCM 21531]|uniref:Uncharacterized protein n=1 Tax=Acetivibrio straminisolvens JCM 21531 TaxID=1294263 RepID=W4VAI5_9FIRM|nr:hypothetical protein JCM21531_3797 [Acetivibrio straminisolvens JCM 21531]